ncbi:MAG TPA: hypothetical protein VFJ19_20070 [Nocardioidaceae bacterium]|nr:hypothetical protein [Nocardioidaceae bacterium]
MRQRMLGRRRGSGVSAELVGRIEQALAHVDEVREQTAPLLARDQPLRVRRAAHREIENAFLAADAPLRAATRIAREHSYHEWSVWRSRLSQLDAAMQVQLFAASDDPSVLPVGSIRAVDTGMTGPAIGDLIHGASRPPGSPATYGLDVETLLEEGRVSSGAATAADANGPPKADPTPVTHAEQPAGSAAAAEGLPADLSPAA